MIPNLVSTFCSWRCLCFRYLTALPLYWCTTLLIPPILFIIVALRHFPLLVHILLYDRCLPYASTHLVSRPVYYLQFDSSPRHGGFKWEHCRPILYSKLAACCHCAPNVCGDCLCFRSNEKTMHVMSPMLVTRVAMSASHPVNTTILPYYHAPRARAPCPRAR